jgi:antitoxin YefM
MTTTSLAAVEAHSSQVIDEVAGTHERGTVTKNGGPVAVILAVGNDESLMETLEIPSDPKAVADIRQADSMTKPRCAPLSRLAAGEPAAGPHRRPVCGHHFSWGPPSAGSIPTGRSTLQPLRGAHRPRHLLPHARPARYRRGGAAVGPDGAHRHRGLGGRGGRLAGDPARRRPEPHRHRRLVTRRLLRPSRGRVREAFRALRRLGRESQLGRGTAAPARA